MPAGTEDGARQAQHGALTGVERISVRHRAEAQPLASAALAEHAAKPLRGTRAAIPALAKVDARVVLCESPRFLWLIVVLRDSRDPRSFRMAEILSWMTPEEDELEDQFCVEAEAFAREMERLEQYRQSMCMEDRLAAQLRSYSDRLAVVDVVQPEQNPHQQAFTFLIDLPGEYQQLQHHR
jgi:hypothetical protein